MHKNFEKIQWLIFRWSRMKHPEEDFYRVKQIIQNRILDRFFANRQEDVFIYQNNLSLAPADDYIIRLKNSYSIFQVNIPLDYHNWLIEPKNKIESPVTFKGKIDYKNFETAGENKYIFELNRLHILPALAYCKKQNPQDNTTLKLLTTLISSWIKQNPYLHSVNWKSGIEVAIRSFNLLSVRMLLSDVSPASEICKKLILLSAFITVF